MKTPSRRAWPWAHLFFGVAVMMGGTAPAAPLDFITPPIKHEASGFGICTGGRQDTFTDRRHERFNLLTFDAEAETRPKQWPRHFQLSIVHGDSRISTTDGDATQRQLLELLSAAAQNLRAKSPPADGDSAHLQSLEGWINDLRARLAPGK